MRIESSSSSWLFHGRTNHHFYQSARPSADFIKDVLPSNIQDQRLETTGDREKRGKRERCCVFWTGKIQQSLASDSDFWHFLFCCVGVADLKRRWFQKSCSAEESISVLYGDQHHCFKFQEMHGTQMWRLFYTFLSFWTLKTACDTVLHWLIGLDRCQHCYTVFVRTSHWVNLFDVSRLCRRISHLNGIMLLIHVSSGAWSRYRSCESLW